MVVGVVDILTQGMEIYKVELNAVNIWNPGNGVRECIVWK